MKWRDYENQVFLAFNSKHPDYEILFDQKIRGRYSKVLRQIDIVVKPRSNDFDIFGAFDCKNFNKKVTVKTIDSMFGFLDDIGTKWGGVVTSIGYSNGARNRALAAGMDIRIIPFSSPNDVVDNFIPSFDFSDPRNSMYIPLI